MSPGITSAYSQWLAQGRAGRGRVEGFFFFFNPRVRKPWKKQFRATLAGLLKMPERSHRLEGNKVSPEFGYIFTRLQGMSLHLKALKCTGLRLATQKVCRYFLSFLKVSAKGSSIILSPHPASVNQN